MTDESLRSVRERLGRVGVWLASLRPAPIDEERRAVRRIEAVSYTHLDVYKRQILKRAVAFFARETR